MASHGELDGFDSSSGETPEEAALLAHHANLLAQGLSGSVERWALNAFVSRTPADAYESAQSGADQIKNEVRDTVLPAVEQLLSTDIDHQWTSPLEIVRSLVGPITEALRESGAPLAVRNQSSVELRPDDLYNIAPATFAEIDPSLRDLGLAWGAAKAHVHLKRHRPPSSDRVPVVVVCAPDLGDRSRFDPYQVKHVRNFQQLTDFANATEPDLVLVDLDRVPDPIAFRIENAHVVGFGSHVETERNDAALDAGYDAVMARSIFFRRLPELLAPVKKSPE